MTLRSFFLIYLNMLTPTELFKCYLLIVCWVMIIWVACEWFLVCCWLLYCSGTFGWDLGRRWRIFDLLFVTFFGWLFLGWTDRTSNVVFLIDCWWFSVHSFAFLIGCVGSYFCRDVWWVDRFLLWFFPICAPSNSNYNSCFKLSIMWSNCVFKLKSKDH